MKYAIMFLLLVSSVFAANEHTDDWNVDDKTELCYRAYIPVVCDGAVRSVDSSNKFSSADIEEGIDNSNSVQDVELSLLEEELSVTQKRTYNAWNNILSVMVLVLEAVKILFYVMQIFIMLHLPYFYVKMLVWVKEMSMGWATSRRNKR